MLSKHSFNSLADTQRSLLFNNWKSQWRIQYFLNIAWLTGRHLESVIWSEEHLIFRRSSGVGHFIKGDGEFFLQQLLEGPLLLHESLMPENIDGDQIQVEHTSYLMCAPFGAYALGDLNSNIFSLNYEDHAKVHFLYKQYMKGSLSIEDFQLMSSLGAYSVGYLENGSVVAVGHVGITNEKDAYIYGILVHPDYRGKGCGKHVMFALHSEAANRGWNLHLLTNNSVAISLYEGLGYKKEGQMLKVSKGLLASE